MPSRTEAEERRDDEVSEPFIAANIDKIAPYLENQTGQIAKAEEKAQKARSELGNIYQKIETDFHGHRGAVKLIRTLVSGTTDAAHDFMRTFLPLARRFNLIPGEDLVDMMESGKPPEDDGERGVSSADMAPRRNATVHPHPAAENAIDRAKRAMKGGNKPPAPAGPPGDTDLVQAGEDVAKEIEEQRRKDAEDFEAGTTH
jgi:hypothetical protein